MSAPDARRLFIAWALARLVGVAGLAVVLQGCGKDAGLWIRIEAPLRVPDRADGVRVEVLDAAVALVDRTYALDDQFPATLMLLTSEAPLYDGRVLDVRASALKTGALAAPWATASGQATLERGATAEVVLTLCDCL